MLKICKKVIKMINQDLISYPLESQGRDVLYQQYILREDDLNKKWVDNMTEWFQMFINKEAITQISGPIVITDAQYISVDNQKIKLKAHITTPEGSIMYRNWKKMSKAYTLELYAAGIQMSLETLKNPKNNPSVALAYTKCIADIYSEHLKNYFKVLFGIKKNYLKEYKKIFPETKNRDSFDIDDFYDYVTGFWDASKNMNDAVKLVNLGLKSIKEPSSQPCVVGSNDIFSLMARLRENKSYFLSGNKNGENLKNKDDTNFFPNNFTFISDLKISNIPVVSVNSSHTDEFIKTEISTIGEFVVMNNTDFELYINNEIEEFDSKGYNLGLLDRHKKEIVTLRIQDFLNNCSLIGNFKSFREESIWKEKYLFINCLNKKTLENIVIFFKKKMSDDKFVEDNKISSTSHGDQFLKGASKERESTTDDVIDYFEKIIDNNLNNPKTKISEKEKEWIKNFIGSNKSYERGIHLSFIVMDYLFREIHVSNLKWCVENDFILPIVPVIIRPFMKFNTKACCLTTTGAVGYYRGKPLATMNISAEQKVNVGFKIRGGGIPIKPELVFRLPDFDVNKPISGCNCEFMDRKKINNSYYLDPNNNVFPKNKSLMCFYIPLGTEKYVKNHLNMSGEYNYLKKQNINVKDEHDDGKNGYKGYLDGMKDLWSYCGFKNISNSDDDDFNSNAFAFDLHRTGCIRYEDGSDLNKFNKKKPSFGHFKNNQCFPVIDDLKVSFQNN